MAHGSGMMNEYLVDGDMLIVGKALSLLVVFGCVIVACIGHQRHKALRRRLGLE
jgi:SOS-response transcriptional repressor LexA